MFSRFFERWRATAVAVGDGFPSPASNAERFHNRLILLGDLILRHRWTPLLLVLATIFVHILLREALFPRHDPLQVGARACAAYGEWFDMRTADIVDQSHLMRDIATRPMVLLGKTESGDLDEGRWISFTIAALHAVRRQLIVAVEAVPSSQQTLLESWVRGDLTEFELLRALEWQKSHAADPETFLPLFRLARIYRMPLVAIGVNADAALGETHVKPAPLPEGYRRSIAALFVAEKLSQARAVEAGAGPTGSSSPIAARRMIFSEELAPILVDPEFVAFVEARRNEDWLIARNLANLGRRPGRPLVVAVIGRNHLEFGWGVPAQLAAHGIDAPAVLLPFSGNGDCALVRPGIGDAVFVLQPGSLASATAALPLREPAPGLTPLTPLRRPAAP
jgi:uncharacterized iron-regulated protein